MFIRKAMTAMGKPNKLQVLKKYGLFKHLNEAQLAIVEKMCTSGVFEPGTTICKQDGKGEKVYVVEDSLVGIILELGPLAQRQVQSASKYDVFGWPATIEPLVYTATVKAIKKTTTFAFS